MAGFAQRSFLLLLLAQGLLAGCATDDRSARAGGPPTTEGEGEGEGDDAGVTDGTRCDGRMLAPPCNGCPADTLVPPGWVCVPAGHFEMGSPGEECAAGCRCGTGPGQCRDPRCGVGCPGAVSSAESPQHRVVFAVPFLLNATEATTEQYGACVRDGSCTNPIVGGSCSWGVDGQGGHPINCVDWVQARAYCHWAGGTLPAEAQWEYAARAGTGGLFYAGGEDETTYLHSCVRRNPVVDGIAVFCANAGGQTAPVGSKRPNPWGLYDMLGNVAEWVEDCWNDSFDGAPADGTPWIAGGACEVRVVRGGSWHDEAWNVRSASRNSHWRDDWQDYPGVRCVRAPTP